MRAALGQWELSINSLKSLIQNLFSGLDGREARLKSGNEDFKERQIKQQLYNIVQRVESGPLPKIIAHSDIAYGLDPACETRGLCLCPQIQMEPVPDPEGRDWVGGMGRSGSSVDAGFSCLAHGAAFYYC
uniref:Uncharacterized protein n=1 Tax=Crocodylus porosus TaxID=8502 RepID=A0A7M4EYU1_CROPO